MRKIILVFGLFLSLVACSRPTPGLEEVTNVPESIQEHVNPQYRLQSIRAEDGGSYLVLHSTGDVTADITINEKSVRIEFVETNVLGEDAAVSQYTYYLYLEGEDNILEVFVNDEPCPFDSSVL